MNMLIRPAVALMGRLRFRSKFVLSGIVAGALLVWLGVTAVGELNERVRMIESERAAVAIMATLVEWNKVLIENRRIVITTTPGDNTVRSRLQQQAGVIEKTLAQIEQEIARAKPHFDMGEEVKGLRQGWQELQKKVEALAVDAEFAQKGFAAHAPEYGRLYAFMRDMGNKSRMALDPDLDLFYLGFPLANNTPSTAGIIVRIAAYATLNVPRGEVNAKDKIFYEVTEARLSDTFTGVETMLKQAMSANPVAEKTLAPAFDKLKATSKELISFVRKNFIQVDSVSVTQPQIQQAAQPSIDAAWALVEQNRALMDTLLAERASAAVLMRNVLAALVAAAVLLSIYLFIGMYYGIGTSLARARAAANAFARGDLGKVPPAESKDEFADLLGELAQADRSLAKMIAEVHTASGTILTATKEIAAGNSDLSQRTEEQASSLEETASSMEELTSTVKQNAENARQANQLAASASTMAVKGGEVVGQVVHSMSSINESSKKIADIIGVIDGIAFQTNILALNAAVEAARAGEQGRGFAVVASEVRTLAQRSAAAAKEIKALITDSVAKVDDGIEVGRSGRPDDGRDRDAVKRVTDIMAEIAAASQEQTSGIEQVNQAITQMDQVTQQNAALVEEAAAAAESMQEQAQSLTKAVAIFKLNAADADNSVRSTDTSVLRDTAVPQHARNVDPEGTAQPRSP